MLTEFLNNTVNPLIEALVPGGKLISGLTSLASGIGSNAYIRSQNALTQQRDDTTYQRTVADMQSAGISPATLQSQLLGQTRGQSTAQITGGQFDNMDTVQDRQLKEEQAKQLKINNDLEEQTALTKRLAEIENLLNDDKFKE